MYWEVFTKYYIWGSYSWTGTDSQQQQTYIFETPDQQQIVLGELKQMQLFL